MNISRPKSYGLFHAYMEYSKWIIIIIKKKGEYDGLLFYTDLIMKFSIETFE